MINREYKRMFNLLCFDADTGGGTGGGTGGEDDKGDKTYTKAEVEALLQRETDKRVTEALKKQERKSQEKIKEAERLARMSEEEKFKYELEQREKNIAEKEQALSLMENKSEASKILADKGLSLDLVDFIVTNNADVMMANIKTLEKAFKQSVTAEVEKRLRSNAPSSSGGSTMEGINKEKFSKMSIKEQQEIYINNKELYMALVK